MSIVNVSHGTVEKNKSGRPLEPFDLPSHWAKEVLEMYKTGGSDEEARGIIYEMRGTFSIALWYRWMKDEPQFSETIKIGRMLSKSWWYKSGRTSLENKDFSYTGWYMNMKNRFQWKDKTEVESNNKTNISFNVESDEMDLVKATRGNTHEAQ